MKRKRKRKKTEKRKRKKEEEDGKKTRKRKKERGKGKERDNVFGVRRKVRKQTLKTKAVGKSFLMRKVEETQSND